MKRNYDPRKVKRHRSYTVKELAELYEVGPNTVRQWIKKHSLPVIEGTYPVLIHWEAFRIWMTAWQAARKWTCADNEMSCLKCQSGRKVMAGTFRVTQTNEASFMLHGECETCRTPMNRSSSKAKLEADKANFIGNTPTDYVPLDAYNSNPKAPLNPSL